jgi:hypothetical protein
VTEDDHIRTHGHGHTKGGRGGKDGGKIRTLASSWTTETDRRKDGVNVLLEMMGS